MQKLCLIFALGFLALSLAALRMQGFVYDEAGKAVEGATLQLGSSFTRSLKDGSYQIVGQADSLKISRLNFHPQSLKAKEGQLDIHLISQPIQLPTIQVRQSYEPFIFAADKLSVPIDPDKHYYSTMDILGEASGALSQDSPLKGESQSLGLLGNLPRHTLVILDGIPLNADGESFDFSLLDPQNIQSIEIIKNNASVYGGGAAIGGVVLISSKQPSKEADEFQSSLELGSFGYSNLRISLKGSIQNAFYRFSVGIFHADNDFSYKSRPWWNQASDGIRANNAKRQNSLSFGLGTTINRFLLTFQSDLEDFHRQLPGTVNFTEVYRNAFLEGFDSRNRLSLQSSFGAFRADGKLWFNRDKSLYDNSSAPLNVNKSKYRQSLDKAGLQFNLDKAQGLLRINAAAELSQSKYLNENLLRPVDRIDFKENQASLSLKTGLNHEINDWELAGYVAARKDFSTKEKVLSDRVELLFTHYGLINSSWGGTWGKSFALPSPFDLHWKGDSQAIGNPELKSEKSKGGQLWLNLSNLTLNFRCGIHLNQVKDLIQWRQVQMFGTAWKPFNIGKAQLRNLELEGSWQANSWLNLKGDALFTQARDISTLPFEQAPQLMYTPKEKYGIKASVSRKGFQLWAKFTHQGKQYTTPDNLVGTIDGYNLLDLGCETSFKIKEAKLGLHLKLQNVLNKRYEVYPYAPQPGRAVYFGVQVKR